MMPLRLPDALAAWDTPDFTAALQAELGRLGPDGLPLQQALSVGSHADSDGLSLMLLGAERQPERLVARVGLFFGSVIAGCNCADDPTPVERQNEYCELRIVIDPATAEARITLLD